jgi:hypothetical protein
MGGNHGKKNRSKELLRNMSTTKDYCPDCGMFIGGETKDHLCYPRNFYEWVCKELHIRNIDMGEFLYKNRLTEAQIKEVDRMYDEYESKSIKPLLNTIEVVGEALNVSVLHALAAGKMPTYYYYDFFVKNLAEHLKLLDDRGEAERRIDDLVFRLIKQKRQRP